MADDVTLNSGSGGDTIAADDISGVKHQRVKIEYGVDGAATDVSDSNPLPVDDAGGSLTVDNAALAVTGGGAEASALRVTIANDSTGVVSVDDNGGALTVDGTVAVSSVGGTVTVSGTVTANAGSGTLAVSAATLPLPSGASTAANQTTIIGHVDGIEGLLTTIDADTSTLAGAVTGTEMQVDVVTMPVVAVTQSGTWDEVGINDSGNSITVDYATTGSGTATGAIRVELPTNGTGVIATVGAVTAITNALPAGTNAIGKLAANSGVDIGDVDILSIAAGDNNIGNVDIASIAAGDNNIGNVDVVSLPASTNTLEVVGDVAADLAAAGNPVLIGVQAETMADAAPGTRVSADLDVVKVAADRDGAVYVHPHGPQTWSYHLNTSTAQTDTAVHATPGSGLSLYVTDIVFSSGAATAINAFFEEGASTVLGPYYLEAVAGRGMSIHFQTPKKITADTALTLTTSASIAHAVDVTGFIAPG